MPRLTRIPSLLFACRLDTDSGLGRATPPRRAPSPGMGMGASGRHMPSPSGPGSLPPGLISKRRGFDDGSSDFSLTPNLNMEYSGLYLSLSSSKQSENKSYQPYQYFKSILSYPITFHQSIHHWSSASHLHLYYLSWNA